MPPAFIYNSRNHSILLNTSDTVDDNESTTVEIILYYLTKAASQSAYLSTTVEIILYYLTRMIYASRGFIYNSRNYSILLNSD